VRSYRRPSRSVIGRRYAHRVGLVLIVTLVCLPLVEIYLAIQVAHHIGAGLTVLALIALSLCGPWLVKRQGIGVWRRARERVRAGEAPGREVVDGVLLLVAGILLTVPGFLTAAFGIVLLLPPVRAGVRWLAGAVLLRRARRGEIAIRTFSGGRGRDPTAPRGGGPIEAGTHELGGPPRPPGRGSADGEVP